MKLPKIAIVGATGAVGQAMIRVLEQRQFAFSSAVLFASTRSEGKLLKIAGKEYSCEVLKPGCFRGVDIAFFDASDVISKEWVESAVNDGAWVVDNSATYRMDPEILLSVPEVNGAEIRSRVKSIGSRTPTHFKQKVFAGPNCSTVQMVVALAPIQKRYGLERVIVSTYQSTSGAGAAAIEELKSQTQAVLQGERSSAKAFTHRIAFNCIPHIGGFKDDGFTSEEHKLMLETRRLLNLPHLAVTATAVRVPTISCHAETVYVECSKPVDLGEVRKAWESQPGLTLIDEPKLGRYPLGEAFAEDTVEGAAGRDPVYVGRLRQDPWIKNGLHFWVVSDNLRKGAALNAIQIGEEILGQLA
jgi:aspartate-semialdehyde dehydrogenase